MGKMRFQKFIKFSRKRKMPSWVTFRKWSISKCNWMLYFNLFSVFKKMKYKGTLQSICITSGAARISGKNCNLWLVLLLLVKIYLTMDSLIPTHWHYFELCLPYFKLVFGIFFFCRDRLYFKEMISFIWGIWLGNTGLRLGRCLRASMNAD